MNFLLALLTLGCLFRTAELWPTEQPLFDNVTEEQTSGPFYEPTNSSEEFPTGSNAGCTVYEVQCYNSTHCIPNHWICDNYTDCEDNSDEIDCYRREIFLDQFTTPESQITEFTGCNMNQVKCYNSTQCIPNRWICDNYTDCEDNSDEIDCYRREIFLDQYTTPESQITEFTGCNMNQVKCYNSTHCIPNYWICDNYTDCADNSDEIDCYRRETFFYQFTTPKYQTTEFRGCSPNKVQCYNSTQCIPYRWICDNYTDCEDNSDEIDCYRREIFLARESTYRPFFHQQSSAFPESQTFPAHEATNQPSFHQPLTPERQTFQTNGESFANFVTTKPRSKPKTKRPCSKKSFYCGDSCISKSLVCDGKQDCSDGRDEYNCAPTGRK